jgi:hypothetical protein
MEKQMLSLYDYLGRAAGPELGKEVFKFAKNLNSEIAIREVSNSKYTGKVTLYPKYVLDMYFAPSAPVEKDKLPF